MSSTARGGQRSPADWYPTPAWCVHRLLDDIANRQVRGEYADLYPRFDKWLEPCAGEGAIIHAVNERVLNIHQWTAVELREECLPALSSIVGDLTGVIIGDILHMTPSAARYDVCITNPPFSIALDVIRACLPLATHCFFLERLNFLGTAERHAFFRERMPDVYVIPDRISFTSDGKADSIEYAWFHWWASESGRIRLLDLTPLSVRRPKKGKTP
jgi:hypothetical protein